MPSHTALKKASGKTGRSKHKSVKRKSALIKKVARKTVKRNKQGQQQRQAGAAAANRKREKAQEHAENGGGEKDFTDDEETHAPAGPTPQVEKKISDMMFRRAQEMAEAKRRKPVAPGGRGQVRVFGACMQASMHAYARPLRRHVT